MSKVINEYVKWVGKTDWELKKFHGDEYNTINGSSYNSYLIEDEKVVLIDTAWKPFDEEFVENRIDWAAHEAVIEIVPCRRERLIALNRRNCSVNARLGLGDDLPRFVRLRREEHRNVILRHNDLRRAHAGNRLFRAEFAIISVGIADLAAAGHNKPSLLRAAQFRFQKPVAHDARNAPSVSWRDDNNPLAGFNERSVGSLDAVVQIQNLIAQRVRNAFRNVFAVSGAGKIQNHIKTPSQWSISC